MGLNYVPISWNRQKRVYDRTMLVGIGLLLACFIGIQFTLDPRITAETLIIRAAAFTAISLLHIILIIGPLCRLDSAFLPLLYNRRHMGVTMFLFAALHGIFSIIQFHGLGDTNPLVSVFLSNTHYTAISRFPFQVLGFFALGIFFLMAATSHDFWLRNLSPKVWKALHMMVYVAYALVLLHVALGILQYENKPVYWIFLTGGFVLVSSLHLTSGIIENRRINAQKRNLSQNGFLEICAVKDIQENEARGVFVQGQQIAIFRYDGKVSAVNGICRHQMGPLAEGRVIDGCITCPWHGYQYYPHNGQSPPPFTEKLETYQTQVLKGRIWLDPNPKPEGTFVEPSKIQT